MRNVSAINPALASSWRSFQQVLPVKLGPIRTEAQYSQMIELLNSLIDLIGDDEEHELADFLDLVAELIESYENKHHLIPDAEPREVLKFLMESHGLKQADLAEEMGAQSVVSEILAGKRVINVRQAKTLAKRFGISPEVFF